MLSPVTMAGRAPGRITSRNTATGDAPSVIAAKINRRSIRATPCIVLRRIGKKAPMKVIKIILPSGLTNMSIAKGIHATAGIGLSTSSGDINMSAISLDLPTNSPRLTARRAARPKPGKYAFNTAATDKNKSVRVFIIGN